jgi:hypothetical protein
MPNAQATAMADSAFQGDTGAVKAVMKRLQRGSHKRGRAGSSVHRASSVTKMKNVGKQKGQLLHLIRNCYLLLPIPAAISSACIARMMPVGQLMP